MADENDLSLEELARMLSISPRTIRYYQTEGYLPPPIIRSRKAIYTRVHLERLRKILDQRSSKSLSEIVTEFHDPNAGDATAQGDDGASTVEEVLRFVAAKGVEVLISPTSANLDADGLQRLLTRLSVAVNDKNDIGFSLSTATPQGTDWLLVELVRRGLTDQQFQILHPKDKETIQRHGDYVRSVQAFRADSDNVAINHRLQYCLHLAQEAEKQHEPPDWAAIVKRAARAIPLRRLSR